MNNKEKVIELIKSSKSDLLLGEIEYFMETDHEYAYSLADALDDVYQFAEENKERKLMKIIRLILIEAGFYIEAPIKTDIGRDTRFTLNGIKYNCASYWDGWINE